jgi:hypothetical protein
MSKETKSSRNKVRPKGKNSTELQTKKDIELKNTIKSRANYSLAILGMAFVRNGSGRFLNIRKKPA